MREDVSLRAIVRYEYADGGVQYRAESSGAINVSTTSPTKRIVGYAEVPKGAVLPPFRETFEEYREVVEDRAVYTHWKESSDDPGDRLREAADRIAEIAEEAPEGDYDEDTLTEYEAEFGEVPSIQAICRDLASATREIALLIDANEEVSDE